MEEPAFFLLVRSVLLLMSSEIVCNSGIAMIGLAASWGCGPRSLAAPGTAYQKVTAE